jgi:hypothetical protein
VVARSEASSAGADACPLPLCTAPACGTPPPRRRHCRRRHRAGSCHHRAVCRATQATAAAAVGHALQAVLPTVPSRRRGRRYHRWCVRVRPTRPSTRGHTRRFLRGRRPTLSVRRARGGVPPLAVMLWLRGGTRAGAGGCTSWQRPYGRTSRPASAACARPPPRRRPSSPAMCATRTSYQRRTLGCWATWGSQLPQGVVPVPRGTPTPRRQRRGG